MVEMYLDIYNTLVSQISMLYIEDMQKAFVDVEYQYCLACKDAGL